LCKRNVPRLSNLGNSNRLQAIFRQVILFFPPHSLACPWEDADALWVLTRPDEFKWLYAMSAYHHIVPGTKYPAVMGITGANDPRVPSWIVAKFITALEAATSSDRPILLCVDFDAGHGLGSSRTQREEQFADEWTFLLWQTGDPAFRPPKP
jgi:hypothetical protein